MLEKVFDWLHSELNIYTALGCIFDITQSPKHSEIKSITVDFELNDNLCRLIFWETGYGHIEAIDINSEKTLVDESFDIEIELAKTEPFKQFVERLKKTC